MKHSSRVWNCVLLALSMPECASPYAATRPFFTDCELCSGCFELQIPPGYEISPAIRGHDAGYGVRSQVDAVRGILFAQLEDPNGDVQSYFRVRDGSGNSCLIQIGADGRGAAGRYIKVYGERGLSCHVEHGVDTSDAVEHETLVEHYQLMASQSAVRNKR